MKILFTVLVWFLKNPLISRRCAGCIRGPRRLSDSIAIVGAGPAGVHMAYLLKKKGFTDITLLEKSSRSGGKSFTINYRGAPQDMGTVYLSPDYEENIIKLMKKYTGDNLAHLPPASIRLGDLKLSIPYKQYVIVESMRNFNTTNTTIAGMKLVHAMKSYIGLHARLFGNYTGELMPRPSRSVMHRIRGTFMDFLKRENLASLQPIFLASHTMQGYGHLDEISALYGLMWNTPKLMVGLLKRLQGATNTGMEKFAINCRGSTRIPYFSF